MTLTVEAVYDGQVLRPTGRLDFKPNTRLRLTIETLTRTKAKKTTESFLDTALAINIEGPPDWSERYEEYLYGETEDKEK